MYGLKTVEAFGYKNNVRMQRGNDFQAGIDAAPDFGFFLRVGGVITVVRISDEMILQAQRVDGLRQTRRKRYDALDRLGNTNRAAGFVGNFPVRRRCR